MDGSDWIVVLIGAAFVPLFFIGLFLNKRVRGGLGQTLDVRSSLPISRGLLAGDDARLRVLAREVAASTPGCILPENTGFRFTHRDLEGRVDFISDKTEIQVRTRNFIRQVVEIVPTGFPLRFFGSGGKDRLRARGSKAEYDRIFKGPAEEHLLLEVGVPYELRLSPDGMIFRLQSLPSSAAVLGYWLACAFRLVDLIVDYDPNSPVQVTEVTNAVEADSTCQVCGSSLATGGVVRCGSCSTPHHEGCWQYAGKCSTFGCGSMRFVR